MLAVRLGAVRSLVVRGRSGSSTSPGPWPGHPVHDAQRGPRRGAASRDAVAARGLVGEGGDHRVWLNPSTEWTWDRVYSAEAEWVGHLARLAGRDSSDLRRVLAQATASSHARQSSDWQFLMSPAPPPTMLSAASPSTTPSSSASARWRGPSRGAFPPRRRGRSGSSARTFASRTSTRRGVWARPRRAEPHAAARARARDGYGRRPWRPPAAAHPRALEVGRALRGPPSPDRLRALELRELGHAVALRPRAVQGPVAHRAHRLAWRTSGMLRTSSSRSAHPADAGRSPCVGAPPMRCCRI